MQTWCHTKCTWVGFPSSLLYPERSLYTLSHFCLWSQHLIDLVWLKAVDGVFLHGKTMATFDDQTNPLGTQLDLYAFCCGKKAILLLLVKLRYYFPNRVNVPFVQLTNPTTLKRLLKLLIFVKELLVNCIYHIYKLECNKWISTSQKNCISTCENWTCVWDHQSAADMLLTLFRAMNEWQCIFFLKHE